jgi:hypothetical protein
MSNLLCNCEYCTLARATGDASEAELIRRGEDRISRYMLSTGAAFPEAVEALAAERSALWASTVASVAEHYGLDDDQAGLHVLTYAPEIPEGMQ